MRQTAAMVFALLALWAISARPSLSRAEEREARYTVETSEQKNIVGTLHFEASCGDFQATEWFVFAAVAPELPGQTAVSTTLSPTGIAIRDDSPLARPLLTARVRAKSASLRTKLPIVVTYEAMLRSRRLRLLRSGETSSPPPALPSAEQQMYLAELDDIDFTTHVFRQWSNEKGLNRRAGEGEIDFARRVYLALKSDFNYEYQFEMDRRASAVCRAGKSDCGGLSHLFVALMRANQVPARSLYGRWATSSNSGEQLGGARYFQWHVKAEFYAEGVGWVPVDVAQAVRFDRAPQGLRYFGVDQADFLAFHVDPNFVVQAGPFGEQKVESLQRPAWWVRGRGSLDAVEETEDWQVQITPVGKN